MRKTLVDVLAKRVDDLTGDLVLELTVACGRDDAERTLALLAATEPVDQPSS